MSVARRGVGFAAPLPADDPLPPAPIVDAVEPVAGFTTGGTVVTLRGEHLLDAQDVTFDGAAASGLTVVDDRTVTCSTPPGAAGVVEVRITTPDGDGLASFTYVAYPPAAATDVRLHVGDAGGTPGAMGSPTISCDGPRVYVARAEGRYNPHQWDIFFQRSEDRGLTWLPENVRLTTNDPGSSFSTATQICCSGDREYVCWLDDRDDVLVTYFNRSRGAGATWLPADVRIPTTVAPAAYHPRRCCDGVFPYVVWQGTRGVVEDDARGAYFGTWR